jgi:hypothetical protein
MDGVPKKITVKVTTSSTKERQHINVFGCTKYLNDNGAPSMLPKQRLAVLWGGKTVPN